MTTLTTLKTVKLNDRVYLLNGDNGQTYDATCTKAGAAHLLFTVHGAAGNGADLHEVRIARATGMQVHGMNGVPHWFVCNTVADMTGATRDARHTVTDVPVSDAVQASFIDAFGAGTTVRVQVISRDGAVIDSVARVEQTSTKYVEDFLGDSDIDTLLRDIVASRKAIEDDLKASEAPVAAQVTAPVFVLTDSDRSIVARVAKVNAELRLKDGNTDAFAPSFFARTKTLMKVAGNSPVYLTALCDACADAANTLLGVAPKAPEAPVQAPVVAPVIDPPAAPVQAPEAVVDHDGVTRSVDTIAPPVTKAPKAKRAAKTALTVVAPEAPVQAPEAPPVVAPVQAPEAPVQAPSDLTAALNDALTAARFIDTERSALSAPAQQALTALHTALTAALSFAAQAPVKGNRAARRAAAPQAPRAPRAAVNADGLTDRDELRAGAIGRAFARATRKATGPVTADEVLAFGHPRMQRVPAARRPAVAARAAQAANDALSGAAKPARADAPKAPRKAVKAVVAGGSVKLTDAARSGYVGTLNDDELHGTFTVVKVVGARVYARTAAGDEVRLPAADVTAC